MMLSKCMADTSAWACAIVHVHVHAIALLIKCVCAVRFYSHAGLFGSITPNPHDPAEYTRTVGSLMGDLVKQRHHPLAGYGSIESDPGFPDVSSCS